MTILSNSWWLRVSDYERKLLAEALSQAAHLYEQTANEFKANRQNAEAALSLEKTIRMHKLRVLLQSTQAVAGKYDGLMDPSAEELNLLREQRRKAQGKKMKGR